MHTTTLMYTYICMHSCATSDLLYPDDIRTHTRYMYVCAVYGMYNQLRRGDCRSPADANQGSDDAIRPVVGCTPTLH